MLKRLLLLASLAAAATATSVDAPREFPPPEIENGFDYVGQDITNVQAIAPENCTAHCRNTTDCMAFSWNNYQGGTCWLKRGASPIVVNPTVKSGRLTFASPFYHNSCFWYTDVDIVGNDIGNAKAADISGCCNICKSTLGCRAYSWNDYQGGTCWLKSKRGKVVRKVGVKSADAYASDTSPYQNLFFDPWFPLQDGIDFVNHDLENVPASDASKCIKICTDQNIRVPEVAKQCKAFSWSSHNGGTCWLKSAKNETIAKPGVVSAVWAKPW